MEHETITPNIEYPAISKNKDKILAKLAAVQKDIEKMEKDGKNTFAKYNYLTETQLTFKLKTLFDKHGILFLNNTKVLDVRELGKSKSGATNLMTTVQVDYAFVDAESGEYVRSTAVGTGADTGDKGLYKAITGAIKYVYMKTFNIPTGDDPERDTEKKTAAQYRKGKEGEETIINRDDDPLA